MDQKGDNSVAAYLIDLMALAVDLPHLGSRSERKNPPRFARAEAWLKAKK
jgi:hypothetical protein